MLEVRMKQFLTLFLCGLLAQPWPAAAQSGTEGSPDTALESVATAPLMGYAARVSVREISLNLVPPSGVPLASLRTGEARPLGEPTAASPAFPPSPQIGAGSGANRGWLLALGIAIVGTSLAIAALVRANDADDR
jgi:hypothetical protein